MNFRINCTISNKRINYIKQFVFITSNHIESLFFPFFSIKQIASSYMKSVKLNFQWFIRYFQEMFINNLFLSDRSESQVLSKNDNKWLFVAMLYRQESKCERRRESNAVTYEPKISLHCTTRPHCACHRGRSKHINKMSGDEESWTTTFFFLLFHVEGVSKSLFGFKKWIHYFIT